MALKRIFIFFLICTTLFAQCTLQNPTSSCGSLYTFTANPTLQTFLQYIQQSFTAIANYSTRRPQPKIVLTAQVVPASGAWLSTNPAVYGPAIVAYQNYLYAQGITVQDYNWWPSAFTADPNYTPNAAPYGVNFPSTCGSSGGSTFAYGSTPPVGTPTNSSCYALYWMDQAVANAVTKGITMRWGFFPSGNTYAFFTPASPASACGYVANVNPPTSGTVNNYNNCLIPLELTAYSRYESVLGYVPDAQVIEEPRAGMQLFQNPAFSIAQIGTMIQAAYAALSAVYPTIQVGAAATVVDSTYWIQDWACTSSCATSPSTYQTGSLQFLGIDAFETACDVVGTAYSATILAFSSIYTPTALGNTTTSVGVNIPVRITQSEPPEWCPSGQTASLANTYWGSMNANWIGTGLQTTWQEVITNWASATGAIKSVAQFCTIPYLYYTYSTATGADNCDPGTTGAVAAMSALNPTNALYAWGETAKWRQISIQGNVSVSGVVLFHP